MSLYDIEARTIDGSVQSLGAYRGKALLKWNFTKFLVGGEGDVVKRFAPSEPPEKIEGDIAASVGRIVPGPPR